MLMPGCISCGGLEEYTLRPEIIEAFCKPEKTSPRLRTPDQSLVIDEFNLINLRSFMNTSPLAEPVPSHDANPIQELS